MVLWNQTYCFEKRNSGYIYRPTAFAHGFSISEREKDLLLRDLRRLEGRFLIEGAVLIALVAALFMSGVIEIGAPIVWFMFLSVVGVTVLAATAVYRRDRLVARVLGDRSPDIPRLPLRHALMTPKPAVSRHRAISILKSVAVLLGLALAAGDALVFYVIFIASRSLGSDELVALGMGHAGLWVTVAVFNLVLIAGMVFAMRQVQRLRAAPALK